ncbi:hypothetical protein C8Q74DRAFT_1367136 [Fomes fomentarius]|nr:hypothetical protein C8Q74DRAFT_1367136 [Fomes fomentarius]
MPTPTFSNAQAAIVAPCSPAPSLVLSLSRSSQISLVAAAQNHGMLVVGRIISGISVSITSTIIPLYQSDHRTLHPSAAPTSTASQMIPAIVLSVGMLLFPEFPHWLVDNGREVEALEILIKEHVRFEYTEGAKSYLDPFRRPGIYRRATLGASLQMWSQRSSWFYIVYVFQGAGLSGRCGNLIVSSVQFFLNVALTIPTIIHIDRWGRRPMLLAGTLLMGFWLYIVGGLQRGFGECGTVDGSRISAAYDPEVRWDVAVLSRVESFKREGSLQACGLAAFQFSSHCQAVPSETHRMD